MNNLKVTIFFFAYTFLSCSSNQINLEAYLGNLTKEINTDSLEAFSKSNYPSIQENHRLIYNEIRKTLVDENINIMLSNHLDSLVSKDNKELRVNYAAIMLHAYINNMDLNFNKILKYHIDNAELLNEKSNIKLLEEKQEISKKNDLKFEIGDTATFIFPNYSKFKKYIVYTLKYPSDRMMQDIDKIEITGVILDKIITSMNYSPKKEITELLFDLKLIEISDTNAYYDNKVINSSDTIRINVTSYGRELMIN